MKPADLEFFVDPNRCIGCGQYILRRAAPKNLPGDSDELRLWATDARWNSRSFASLRMKSE